MENMATTSSTNGADSEETTVEKAGAKYSSLVATKAVLYKEEDGHYPDFEIITGTPPGESIVFHDSDCTRVTEESPKDIGTYPWVIEHVREETRSKPWSNARNNSL